MASVTDFASMLPLQTVVNRQDGRLPRMFLWEEGERAGAWVESKIDGVWRPGVLGLPSPFVRPLHGIQRRGAGKAGDRHPQHLLRAQQLPSRITGSGAGGQARCLAGGRAATRVPD